MIIVEGLSGYRPRLFEAKLGYRKASVFTSLSVYLLVLSSEQAESQVSSENADFGHRLRLSGEIPPGWRPLRPFSGGAGGGRGIFGRPSKSHDWRTRRLLPLARSILILTPIMHLAAVLNWLIPGFPNPLQEGGKRKDRIDLYIGRPTGY